MGGSCLMSWWKNPLPLFGSTELMLLISGTALPSTWTGTMRLFFTKVHLAKQNSASLFWLCPARCPHSWELWGAPKLVPKRQEKSKKYWDTEQECSRHYLSGSCPDSELSPSFAQVCSQLSSLFFSPLFGSLISLLCSHSAPFRELTVAGGTLSPGSHFPGLTQMAVLSDS